ncbi:hypothetical protein HPY42_01125 [Coprothermobacteraceae bacterium]|nr:hypothetical protein [Coprothermobacteraceae bacterium]
MMGHMYYENPGAFVLSAIFLIWLLVVVLQSTLGVFEKKLTGGQVAGLVLVVAGIVWMLFTVTAVNVGWFYGNLSLPDPWYLMGGILIIYGTRYLLSGRAREAVSLILALAVIVSGFYFFGYTTPPSWNGWRTPLNYPEFSSPNPSPSQLESLRKTPTGALDWAEVNTSALLFESKLGSIYLGQREESGFGTYLYTYTKRDNGVYVLKPVDGNRFGGLFLGNQVTTATLSVDFGNIYAEVGKPLERLSLITKAGDIRLTVNSVIPQIAIKSNASNIRIEVPRGVKVVFGSDRKGLFVGNIVNSSGDGTNGTITLELDVRAGNVYITEMP